MGLREKRTEETKSLILEAAMELFSRDGFDSTSLRSIAERVGIKDPAILHHFSNKDSLRNAVLTKAIAPMLEIAASLYDENQDIARRLENTFDDLIDFCQENPEAARMVCLEILLRPEETQKVFAEVLPTSVVSMKGALEKGVEAGEIRPDLIDPFAFVQCTTILILSTHAALPTIWSFWVPDMTEGEMKSRLREEIKRILLAAALVSNGAADDDGREDPAPRLRGLSKEGKII